MADQNGPKHGDTLDCGHVLRVPESTQQTGTGGTGYGRDRDHKTRCYDCCAVLDRASIAAGESMTLYLASDGHTVTNWPGSSLMLVTRLWRTSAGGFARNERTTRVWARSFDGRLWYGRGPGEGMYIRMHRSKQRSIMTPETFQRVMTAKGTTA